MNKYTKRRNRTDTYIATITGPAKLSDDAIINSDFIKNLKSVYGKITLRGRHSNRKAVLGEKYRRGTQNDIPWRLAETIDIYKRS